MSSSAATAATDTKSLRARIRAMMPEARRELAELVAFRSVADPQQYPPQECADAARWLRDALVAAGLSEAALHETPDGSTAVIARRAAPAGAPTVLLYCHYDVQPPLDEDAWNTPPFELTERDGRWYGRGAADCKGSAIAHLLALRALGDDPGIGITVVAEGSEEQATGGLERFVTQHPEELRADAILVCDTGNVAVGEPTLTTSLRGAVDAEVTVSTLDGPMHSGMFGGPAPDAMTALVRMLATLHDTDGSTTVRGLDSTGTWTGADYPAEQFRRDAGVRRGVHLTGSGTVADQLWARPALTVVGVDCPPVVGSAAAVQATVRARLNLRIPPGVDPDTAYTALARHLEEVAPWQVQVSIRRTASGPPFEADTSGPAYTTMCDAMASAYGRRPVTQGQGGSIPLCTTLARTYPEAEIMLLGVCEPLCRIHAPNESVDPTEIERTALSEAVFLRDLPAALR
ncbi:dipeptidase [Lipingzhangella sp. LS1_29]|uniref:Dipeptidase n=1 Tax=Lipingzhangella rawalii TaxID=2055835 RepID=A0ABU2H4P9_9ACTN|nr:dipeptidase [Lipingzhangella rawalii]MDS1270273.1 dipeptidase [Lipingzhangella rawalii]